MNNLPTFFSGSSSAVRFFGVQVFAIAVLSFQPVYAESDPLKKLMQTNNCVACHQIDKRKYGPQFYEVAEKYQGDSAAAAKPHRVCAWPTCQATHTANTRVNSPMPACNQRTPRFEVY